MNVIKVNVEAIHSEEFLRLAPDGTPLYKVELTVNGEGNTGRHEKIMWKDFLEHVKEQGYYLT